MATRPPDLDDLRADLDADLDVHDLAGTDNPNVPTIRNDRHANHALRDLADARAAADAIDRIADEYAALIEGWRTRRRKGHDDTVAFRTGQLSDYLARRRAADDTIKSIDLPSGRIRSRTTADGVTVTDAAALLAWAHRNDLDLPHTVKVKVTDAALVVDRFTSDDRAVSPDGEPVPGVTRRHGRTTYTVDPVARP